MAKILVAEQNTTTAAYLARTLKKAGHSLQIVDNSLDVWRAANREAFDVLVIDIVMPGIDSFVLAQKALQENPDLQIIFLTGFAAVAMDTYSTPAYAPAPITTSAFHLSEINARIRYLMGQGGLPARGTSSSNSKVIYADFAGRVSQNQQMQS